MKNQQRFLALSILKWSWRNWKDGNGIKGESLVEKKPPSLTFSAEVHTTKKVNITKWFQSHYVFILIWTLNTVHCATVPGNKKVSLLKIRNYNLSHASVKSSLNLI
mmetsp:Transcript_32569/g.49091  ORF Transcript_32569/g.49091 Transcript_32569/m.49091 type:complete len:106 (-) Transcript_32569:58-375(-)